MTAEAQKQQVLENARIAYKTCPLCDAAQIEKLRHADCSKHPLYNRILPSQMLWMHCTLCAHIFTDGYFTDEAARIIFSKTNEHQIAGYDMERQRPISARMIDKVLPYVHEGDWLDVGFGNASLLFTAHEYGFIPVGIDLREDNVRILKGKDIEAYCTDLRTLDHAGRYSVISMADVLEHVPFPKECLASVYRLLREEGIVFISMPNSDSPLWESLSRADINPYWGEIEHYHNFGRQRLYSLLDECGFEPLRYGISERYRACMEVIARKR